MFGYNFLPSHPCLTIWIKFINVSLNLSPYLLFGWTTSPVAEKSLKAKEFYKAVQTLALWGCDTQNPVITVTLTLLSPPWIVWIALDQSCPPSTKTVISNVFNRMVKNPHQSSQGSPALFWISKWRNPVISY